jgi:hypothetical protein
VVLWLQVNVVYVVIYVKLFLRTFFRSVGLKTEGKGDKFLGQKAKPEVQNEKIGSSGGRSGWKVGIRERQQGLNQKRFRKVNYAT